MHFRWMFGVLLKYLWMSNSSETFSATEVDFRCTVLTLIIGMFSSLEQQIEHPHVSMRKN